MILDKKKKKPRKPCVLLVALLLVFIGTARADDSYSISADTLVTGCHLPGTCALSISNIVSSNSLGETIIAGGALSTGDVALKLNHASARAEIRNASNTPVAAFSASGALTSGSLNPTGQLTFTNTTDMVVLVPYVPTMVATPAAPTNVVRALSAIPTAAANTAALLQSAETVGSCLKGFNTGPNTVRIKAEGTPGINGGAAGTYIPLATQVGYECCRVASASWYCTTTAGVPTPAGP